MAVARENALIKQYQAKSKCPVGLDYFILKV